jgi:DNA-binding GntR family transcriptional regulator
MGTLTPEVARGSLSDVAYERILEWIMDGTLGAGDPIPLAKVATSFKISQTPLRESLARLEGQGLVVRLPMRGFKVAERLSPEDLAALMAARMVLEPAIAARAATHATPEGIDQLRQVCKATANVEVGLRYEGYRAYLELSARFHDLVAELSGNRFLRDAANALPTHVQRFRLFGEEGVNDREVALVEHLEVLDAIASHDAVAAKQAMRRHISAVGERSSPRVK